MHVGDLADAVNTFFDRLETYAPVFVPRTPSVVVSLIVTLFALVVARCMLRPRLRRAFESDDVERVAREMALAAGTVGLVLACGVALQMTIYYLQMFASNKQHFTNLKWIPLYLAAARK